MRPKTGQLQGNVNIFTKETERRVNNFEKINNGAGRDFSFHRGRVDKNSYMFVITYNMGSF